MNNIRYDSYWSKNRKEPKTIKRGFHGARERFAKDANVEKMAKSKIRRSFSPIVSRQWSRKPFLRSLCEVLTTYVRMSYAALSSYGQSTYMKNTRLKCEQRISHALYVGQRSSECAKPSPNVREGVCFGSCVARE